MRLVTAVASLLLLAAPALAGPIETITLRGTLTNGWNGVGGGFGADGTSLVGQNYTVSLAYNPSLFTQSYSVDSCGPNAGLSCYFTIGGANTVTETLTIGNTTQSFLATSGGFTLTGGAVQKLDFTFYGANGLALTGSVTTPTGLLLNAVNANNPILANLDTSSVALASFYQSTNAMNAGGAPARLTTVYANSVPVAEPASMFMLGAGVLGAGLLRWRRERRTGEG